VGNGGRPPVRDWGEGALDLGGQGGKVDMLLQGAQRIPELVELGFPLLAGKQAVLDHV
jgi:hypothetical protein